MDWSVQGCKHSELEVTVTAQDAGNFRRGNLLLGVTLFDSAASAGTELHLTSPLLVGGVRAHTVMTKETPVPQE